MLATHPHPLWVSALHSCWPPHRALLTPLNLSSLTPHPPLWPSPQLSYRRNCVFPCPLDHRLHEAGARHGVTLQHAWNSSWHKVDSQPTSVGTNVPPVSIGCVPPISACTVFRRVKVLSNSGEREAGTGGHWNLRAEGRPGPGGCPEPGSYAGWAPLEPASLSLSAPCQGHLVVFHQRRELKSPGV